MEKCQKLLNESNSLNMDLQMAWCNKEIQFSDFQKINRFRTTKIYRPLKKKLRSALSSLKKGDVQDPIDISQEKEMYEQMKDMFGAAKAKKKER